jgi:hypothetical protein
MLRIIKVKRLTIEQFIEKAKKIHGEKYDYSEIEYKNCQTKVKIICPKHGKFLLTGGHHLSGGGCKKCAFERIGKKNRSNIEEFINKSKKIHGNKYDYNKSEYKTSSVKICIICKKHGEFWQRASSHLGGDGCPKCGRISGNIKETKSQKDFIKESRKIFGNKYDYSKVKYINNNTMVCLVCPKHGIFFQKPRVHLSRQECFKCGREKAALSCTKTTNDFIKKANEIHGDKYIYNKVNYVCNKSKVEIICKKHGSFKQFASGHLQGSGCPHCLLKSETEVGNILKEYFIGWFIKRHKYVYKDILNGKPHRRFCDFWMQKEKIKVIVEYDGHQHFMPMDYYHIGETRANEQFKKQKLIDKRDDKFCKKNNIILHRIKYDENKEESIMELKKKIAI